MLWRRSGRPIWYERQKALQIRSQLSLLDSARLDQDLELRVAHEQRAQVALANEMSTQDMLSQKV